MSITIEPPRPTRSGYPAPDEIRWGDPVEPTHATLATVQILYLQPYTFDLWGVPYAMRPGIGQAPGHIRHRQGWIRLDARGNPLVKAWLAALDAFDRGVAPGYPHEWTELAPRAAARAVADVRMMEVGATHVARGPGPVDLYYRPSKLSGDRWARRAYNHAATDPLGADDWITDALPGRGALPADALPLDGKW